VRIVALLLGFCLFADAAGAQDGPFLFDVLLKPAYRSGWQRLIKEVNPIPDWLAKFVRTFDGVAGPMKPETIDGKAYELYFVCKPHACAADRFEVMFEAGSKRAFGALIGGGAPPAFYGDPAPAVQEALAKALQG
jgi:hypothetical protein